MLEFIIIRRDCIGRMKWSFGKTWLFTDEIQLKSIRKQNNYLRKVDSYLNWKLRKPSLSITVFFPFVWVKQFFVENSLDYELKETINLQQLQSWLSQIFCDNYRWLSPDAGGGFLNLSAYRDHFVERQLNLAISLLQFLCYNSDISQRNIFFQFIFMQLKLWTQRRIELYRKNNEVMRKTCAVKKGFHYVKNMKNYVEG